MSKRNKEKYIGVDYVRGDLLDLLTGKARLVLPEDVEIVHTRSGTLFNVAEFLVRSEEYAELETGYVIPIEVVLCEKITTITTQHTYSLSEMVKWFKKLIEEGNIPDEPAGGRSDELTAAYCDELLEDLKQ